MTFTNPLAFVLFICIPFVLYLGWPRLRYRRSRDITSLALRVSIVTLLVLALAGVQVVQSAEKLAVIFLVDASDSVGPVGVDTAIGQVQQAISQMGTDDQAGVIVFGGDAQVERTVNDVRELGTLRAAPNTGNTDIAGAIRLALALFPADAARRIVIFSDGVQTLGNAEAAAELARASGVQISYVSIQRENRPEVRVADFEAPPTVQQGQQFDLSMSIVSDIDTEAQVIIYAGGTEIRRETVQLQRGTNNRTLPLEGNEAGFRDFSVVVEPTADDGFYQNNSLATFSQIVGPSRVLIVSTAPEDTQYLRPALEEAGLIVDQIAPDALPITATGLVQYDSVVIANVPAPRISLQRMEVLQTYVRDLGGGLVFVGGPNAYGPGGYFRTPMEDTLPVEMQIKDQQRLPKLTIAYVIDRSGSMGATTAQGVPMIELAKEAINRSVELLQPTDRAAIATFDASAYWVAEFQDVLDRQQLQRLVGTLSPDGGTDILAGMQLTARDIVNEPAELKHIILLTDGGADPNGLVPLTRELFENSNVTTTTISIGVDSPLLEQMAQAGGGNYHIVMDASSIPTIFSQETVLATRSYIFEQEFVPSLTARNPIMDGINALPPLLGYVGVTAKNASQVVLRAPNEFQDPVLAAWQYGLGRSVAFTSDATARWGVNWVTWGDFSRFWSQAVRWTITEGTTNNVETRVVMEDNQAKVIVDARNEDGTFLNGLTLQTSVVDPEFGNQRLTLQQVAPGRYEAAFTPSQEGAYLLRLTGQATDSAGGTVDVNQTTGWVMSYSPEYATATSADSVLPVLADITGGRSLSENINRAFDRDIISRDARTPLAPTLLLLAMVLLPIDIAVRRLIITRTDLKRLQAAVNSRFNRPELVPAPTERMSTLLNVKDRVRQQSSQTVEEPASTTAGSAVTTMSALRSRREQAKAEQSDSISTPAAPEKPRHTPSVQPAAPATTEGSLSERLLKKRKEREGEK
jgi:uncharacterized membrane protein